MSGDDIKKKVRERIAAEEAANLAPAKPKPVRRELSHFDIITCAWEGHAGDAVVYIYVNFGRVLYNQRRNVWYKWTGHCWEEDILAADALAAMEKVVDKYREVKAGLKRIDRGEPPTDPVRAEPNEPGREPPEEETAEDKKSKGNIKTLDHKISRLHSVNHRDAVLKYVRTCSDRGLLIDGEEMDKQPYMLVCANGVLDLRTGRLHDGRPEDYLSCASPTVWTGLDTPHPNFDKFLVDVFGDEEIVAYMWRVLGMALIGEQRERIFLMLYGADGANGKNTLMDILSEILGDQLMAPIPNEMLLDQGFVKSSAGPSADLMSLMTRRLVYASEPDDGRKFSIGKMKWLTGREKLVARGPHDLKMSYWYSTHFLIVMTNSLPQAQAYDQAFWSRMHMINMRYQFMAPHEIDPGNPFHRPIDYDLPRKLRAEKSGILAGLVRGCLEYLDGGLNPPPQILEATQAYRDSEDLVGRFIRECCLKGPDLRVLTGELYDAFRFWYSQEVSRKGEYSHKRFSSIMTKKNFEQKKSNGRYWQGLSLTDEFLREMKAADNSKLPGM